VRLPHPIPYQGSKRNIAAHILSFFPPDTETLVEPFAGSAAVSIAAAYYRKASEFYLNDVNEPLMRLWKEIVDNPKKITKAYQHLWEKQRGHERVFYNKIRDDFNRLKNPEFLLYLLARCVKASIRYNENGGFNQSPDNRRSGRNPINMEADILAVSTLLRSKVAITSQDYRYAFNRLRPRDLVYMDPPYQGVCGNRDPRYSNSVVAQEFIDTLKELTEREVCFILSYDGRCGQKSYGEKLPDKLGLHHIEIEAGRSSQATLLGRNDVTYESIYLSKALVHRLGVSSRKPSLPLAIRKPKQFELNLAS